MRAPPARSLIPPNSPALKNPLLTPQIPKRPDIRDNKRHAKLIVRTHLSQRDPPVLQRQPAATPVVADLHQLVLQGAIRQVVADPGSEVESFPRLRPIPDQRANLV